MLGEKAPRSSFSARPPGKDSQLSPSVEKVAAGASCIRALCTLPESPHVMHIFYVVGWLFYVVGLAHCTSNRTTHSLSAHPEANGHAKRLLADLQTLALVLSGPSRLQTLNWSLETSSIW